MTQIAPKGEHKRTKTLIYDPTQQPKNAQGETIIRKKRVAAYARVSTEQDAQQKSSITPLTFSKNQNGSLSKSMPMRGFPVRATETVKASTKWLPTLKRGKSI